MIDYHCYAILRVFHKYFGLTNGFGYERCAVTMATADLQQGGEEHRNEYECKLS